MEFRSASAASTHAAGRPAWCAMVLEAARLRILLVLISVWQSAGAPAGGVPVIRPVRTVILPGEPILLRLGMHNAGSRAIEWPFTPDGTPAFEDATLEWSVDEHTWIPCENFRSAAPVANKPLSLPGGATVWATGDFLQPDGICAGIDEAKQGSFRLRVRAGTGQLVSAVVRVQIKHGPSAGITGPESWGWGFTRVRLLGARQCSVWLPDLDWKALPAPSQRGNRQDAEDLGRYLRRYPDFPFRDCLRLGRASALAGAGETGRAREEFSSLRSSTRDGYIKEQCRIALEHL